MAETLIIRRNVSQCENFVSITRIQH